MQSQQDTFMRLLRLRQLVADLSNVTHRKEDISANVVAISLCAAPSDLSPAQEMAAQQLIEIHKAIAVIDGGKTFRLVAFLSGNSAVTTLVI